MNINNSLRLVKDYIEKENYKGYDPYDVLKSPLFRLPLIRSNKVLRFGAQQLVRRACLNLRPFLFVPKGYNPVAIGLCIQAYAYLYESDTENRNHYRIIIEKLLADLIKLIPSGYSGACWGYDFDWEARYARISAYQPTVVATGIITHALFQAYKITGIEKCSELIASAALFVVNDLNRTYHGDMFAFSYSPFDKQQVFNATMKGARLLSQAHTITRNDEYLKLAYLTSKYTVSHQNNSACWAYSLNDGREWMDNYHTGYIIDCLHEFQTLSQITEFDLSIKNAYAFYKRNFITMEGVPKFYNNKVYPVDCTAASQTILTLCRFGDYQLASAVAQWMAANMQSGKGNFYFRKYNNYTIKTSFMRWSNAWMFVALAFLKSKTSNIQ